MQLLDNNVIRQTVFLGRIYRHRFRVRLCILLWCFLLHFQPFTDTGELFHSVYREARSVLERDITHRHIAADFAYAFNDIPAVVYRDFPADKVRVILLFGRLGGNGRNSLLCPLYIQPFLGFLVRFGFPYGG